MSIRNDRGAISMSLIAPIVAALIGGAAAVTAAIQVVNLAPSAPTTPRTGVLTNGDPNSPELQYGTR